MDSVLPNQEPYVPQKYQKVSVYVGEPLIFDELVQKMKKENRSLVKFTKFIFLQFNSFFSFYFSKKFVKL